jgi:hypothetical protein
MAKSVFDDVGLKWKGVDYTIPAGRMMEAIARIEEHISLEDMQFQRPGGNFKIKRAKISAAFASVLNMVGANVTEEEIYASLFDKQAASTIVSAITALQMMMVPPIVVTEEVMKDGASGKENPDKNTAASSGNASSLPAGERT